MQQAVCVFYNGLVCNFKSQKFRYDPNSPRYDPNSPKFRYDPNSPFLLDFPFVAILAVGGGPGAGGGVVAL